MKHALVVFLLLAPAAILASDRIALTFDTSEAVAVLAYIPIAYSHGDLTIFSAMMAVDSFGLGFAGIALMTYMSSLTSLGYHLRDCLNSYDWDALSEAARRLRQHEQLLREVVPDLRNRVIELEEALARLVPPG